MHTINCCRGQGCCSSLVFQIPLFPQFTDLLILVLVGNKEIEAQLKKDKSNAKRQVNILLLGAGESGKVS